MAYRTYITEALICGSKPSGTSDRTLHLFTREAGMLLATARSVREERSTQRLVLQDFAYARLTLVRGKAGWRITGAEPIAHLYASAPSREARALLRNTVLLLRRLIHGEEPHPALFDIVLSCVRNPQLPEMRGASELVSLTILRELGYVGENPRVHDFYARVTANDAQPEPLTEEELNAVKALIEEALGESHL